MAGSDGRIDIDTKIDTGNVERDMREMQKEVRAMQKAFKATEMKAMMPFRKELMKVQGKMLGLSREMGSYKGTNEQFMSSVQKLGKEQKKATDNMINNNKMLGMSMIQTAGTMLNMTTQSQRISDNYDRMGNPMYKVNKAGLAIANSLNQMANRGNAAVLALKMLGPNAKMKDLLNMQMMITQGMMRFQMVAMAAAVAAGLIYTALYKAASGPDPSEVYKKQAEALAEYRDAVISRTKEIMDAWAIFENVQLNKTSAKKLMANLQEQVKILGSWRTNLATIAQKAGSEFSNYLSQMGPQSAGEVAKIAAMSGPQLDKYVALWREKMRLAKEQALTELEGLRLKTKEKIQQLQDSLTPLGVAAENMKKNLVEAFGPMVEVFGMIMTPIVTFIGKVAEMVTKFNEAHPTITRLISAFLILVPILTLILAPLAVGIGLWAGLSAAFAATFPLLAPLVTGFFAIIGTVILVSIALVALVAGFIYLWNNVAWFRDGLIAAWEYIRAKTVEIWNAIYNNAIKPAIDAIVSFVNAQLAVLKAFWGEHGAQILALITTTFKNIWANIKMVMGLIKGLFQIVWPWITGIVKIAWNLIKSIVSIGINLVLGIIKTVLALLRGDWEGAWNAIKDTAESIWKNIEGFFESIDLVQIGKDIIQGLIDGIGSMAGAAAKAAAEVAGNVKDSVTGFFDINSPSRVMRDEVGKMIPAGIAVGINADAGMVEAAMKNVANATMSVAPQFTNKPSSLNTQGLTEALGAQMRGIQAAMSQKDGGPTILKLDLGGQVFDAIFEASDILQGKKIRLTRAWG